MKSFHYLLHFYFVTEKYRIIIGTKLAINEIQSTKFDSKTTNIDTKKQVTTSFFIAIALMTVACYTIKKLFKNS